MLGGLALQTIDFCRKPRAPQWLVVAAAVDLERPTVRCWGSITSSRSRLANQRSQERNVGLGYIRCEAFPSFVDDCLPKRGNTVAAWCVYRRHRLASWQLYLTRHVPSPFADPIHRFTMDPGAPTQNSLARKRRLAFDGAFQSEDQPRIKPCGLTLRTGARHLIVIVQSTLAACRYSGLRMLNRLWKLFKLLLCPHGCM